MLASRTRRSAAAWLLPLAAAAGFATMWLGYRQGWGWLATVDSSALSTGYDIGVKHPGWVRFWDAVCTVLAPVTFRLLGVAAAGFALLQNRVRTALLVLISVEFSGLVAQAVKNLADRPRPATALATASSSSFPSGHAVGVMVGVAALLTVFLPVLSRPARLAAVALGVLMVVTVGLGRVALNVHHPSDVLAGWALGYLYFAVCAGLVAAKPRRRPHRLD
ncbi:MAG TPA: phosphatase PAP2 family protein [Mycobacterium sp.]|nr:phosphatase PAP2 family protein [Mycobacterium sp.]